MRRAPHVLGPSYRHSTLRHETVPETQLRPVAADSRFVEHHEYAGGTDRLCTSVVVSLLAALAAMLGNSS